MTREHRLIDCLCWPPEIAAFLEEQTPEPTIYPAGAAAPICNVLNSWVDGVVMRNAARFMVDHYIKYVGEQNRALYEKKSFLPNFGITTLEATSRKNEWERLLNENWRLLESTLKGQQYLLGNRISYADFGVASRLRLMEIIGGYVLPGEFPELRRWLVEVKHLGGEGAFR